MGAGFVVVQPAEKSRPIRLIASAKPPTFLFVRCMALEDGSHVMTKR